MKIIRPMSPLRRRMLEDMQIRNYSPHTIDGYLRYVAQFAKHFGTSPDRLGPEHIRPYQLHLLHQQASKSIFIHKARHGFLYIFAESSRLYLRNCRSTSKYVGERQNTRCTRARRRVNIAGLLSFRHSRLASALV